MEVWLQRNKQCPACRVEITRENPCRPVLGGLCDQVDTNSDFSCREMRRARMEMLFKDYEMEIERLQRQNERLTEEARLLNERLAMSSAQDKDTGSDYSEADSRRFKLISQKLEETTQVYDQAKREARKLKEENKALQEHNGKLSIENKNLRLEVGHRSPRKYGRTAMAAMEARMEEYQKEITALKKALDRSDTYIDDLEKQIEQLSRRQAGAGKDGQGPGTAARGLPMDASYGESESLDDSRLPAELSEDLPTNEDDDTFQLELPSPTTPGSRSLGRLKLESNHKEREAPGQSGLEQSDLDDTNLSHEETLEMPSPVQNIKKKLRFSEQESTAELIERIPTEVSDVLPLTQQAILSMGDKRTSTSGGLDFTRSLPVQTVPATTLPTSSLEDHRAYRSSSVGLVKAQAAKPQYGAGRDSGKLQPSTLDTSITPEMEDCMKLFEEAERKVEGGKAREQLSSVVTHGANANSALYRSASERGLNAGRPAALNPSLFPTGNIPSTLTAPSSLYPPLTSDSSRLPGPPFGGSDPPLSSALASSLPSFHSSLRGEHTAMASSLHESTRPRVNGVAQSSAPVFNDFTATLSQPPVSVGGVLSSALASSYHGVTSVHTGLATALQSSTGDIGNTWNAARSSIHYA